MVWAGISQGYHTDLNIFKRGSVTTVRYRDEVPEPIGRLYAAAVGRAFVLMDDNATSHRADIVDVYLEREGIVCMAWSAYSPDFNPIENLWDALGRAVSSRFPPPPTLIELETALQEEWRLLNSAVVDHIIESMVRRCKKELIEWCMKKGMIASSYECPKCNDQPDVTQSAIERFLRNRTSHADCMFDHYFTEYIWQRSNDHSLSDETFNAVLKSVTLYSPIGKDPQHINYDEHGRQNAKKLQHKAADYMTTEKRAKREREVSRDIGFYT
ncbi:transposable element Tcb1 transposase [Trichonephila clavipes]|nr:transposable element Tcb1 transposase [Trichonephila clavipes]